MASQDFGREITGTVLWLGDYGLYIRCGRSVSHRLGERVLVDVPTRDTTSQSRGLPDPDFSEEGREGAAAGADCTPFIQSRRRAGRPRHRSASGARFWRWPRPLFIRAFLLPTCPCPQRREVQVPARRDGALRCAPQALANALPGRGPSLVLERTVPCPLVAALVAEGAYVLSKMWEVGHMLRTRSMRWRISCQATRSRSPALSKS